MNFFQVYYDNNICLAQNKLRASKGIFYIFTEGDIVKVKER